MSAPADRRLEYADLLAADRDGAPVPELIHGEIVHKASPRAKHARTQGKLAQALGGFDPDEPDEQGWWIVVEPDVRFDRGLVLRPDLAGWRRERLPELPDGPIDLAPDWVGEVLSPGHHAHDRQRKRPLYAEHGVAHLWLIAPEERTVEAFALRDGQWLLLGTWTDGDEARIAPFERLALRVGALFTPLPRPGV